MQRDNRGAALNCAALGQLVSGKGENVVKFFALEIKPADILRMPDGIHGFLDERDNQIGASVVDCSYIVDQK